MKTPPEGDHHRATYAARINRVLDHIDAHLADTLDLTTLAAVAHFSPWHFHRLFQALTGETLADRVRRRRLECAAQRLLRQPGQTALQISLEVGFGSAEVFSRAFRSHFGVTPTAWRRGAWRNWTHQQREELSKIHQGLSKANQAAALVFRHDPLTWPVGLVQQATGANMQVEMKNFPPMKLAYMRHTGPYGHPGITRTWERFGAWCAQQGLLQPRPQMFGISHDNPEITPAAQCRYDCCVPVADASVAKGDVGVQSFPGGRYACASFTGTGPDIHTAWKRLFAEWLPPSGWQADERPAMELYGEDFTVDPQTGVFSCLLCVPVRPL